MTTSPTSIFSEALANEPLSRSARAALRLRLKHALHQIFLREFHRQEKAGLVTRAQLARRSGKQAAQITRYLSGPSNWTLNTVSDLFAAMGGELDGEALRFRCFVSDEAASAKGDDHPIDSTRPPLVDDVTRALLEQRPAYRGSQRKPVILDFLPNKFTGQPPREPDAMFEMPPQAVNG